MVMDMQEARVLDAGPLTKAQLDSRGLPAFARLEIPITDPVAWNPRVAEALDDLALRLRQIARSRDMNALMMAMETLWAIRTANQKIGIPTKASRSG